MKESGVKPNASFLNVGCGNGKFTLRFAKENPDSFCVGVDISTEQIEVANKRLVESKQKNVEFKICDVYHLDKLREVYPKMFDVVRSRFVVTHLKEPEKALDAMLSMVKPGGLLILEEAGEKVAHEVHPKPNKAMEGWWKMIKLVEKMQQSHRNIVEIALEYLPDKVDKIVHDPRDIEVKGQRKKSMYRMGVEHGIKKMKEMGKPELIKALGYDDPQMWLKEIRKFELDETQSLTVKNFTYIRAIKGSNSK